MAMFEVHCPTHRSRVLLGPRAIDELRNTEHGVELHWHCHCGARGVLSLHRHDDFAVAA
jgi:hypothetical protein